MSDNKRLILQVLLNSPMLLESELEAITSQAGMMNKTFNLHYESGKPGALKEAVQALCRDVEAAVKNGCEVLLCCQLHLVCNGGQVTQADD